MKQWLEQYHNRILAVFLLVGTALRGFQIGSRSFWYDEAFSSLIASLSIEQIWSNVVVASIHPPGYYLLLHFWLWLGQGEGVIRGLSLLFSVGAILLIYGVGRWLFDRATAVVAAGGMAIFPFQIYFAQEARMYGLVVFLATALTWIFLYGVITKNRWFVWLGYIFVATAGLYVHYFFAFLMIALHLWWLLNWRRYKSAVWPLSLADGLIALLFLPQANQALNNTGAYLVGGRAWQAIPNVLSPLTTIFYLLFAHRSPIWVVPIGLFLTLALLLLTFWESRRRLKEEQHFEAALWVSLVTPIVIVLGISWVIQPIYLERSFSIVAPALILLLARGTIAAPRLSPTPYLALALIIPISLTLVTHFTTPDPAKPPVREAVHMIETNFAPGDVSLHLQDASFMPAVWYDPHRPHLLDAQGVAWAPPQDHRFFGGDVVPWQTAVFGANRLWVTAMPGFMGPQQQAVFDEIQATYLQLNHYDWGAVQLYLYDLRSSP